MLCSIKKKVAQDLLYELRPSILKHNGHVQNCPSNEKIRPNTCQALWDWMCYCTEMIILVNLQRGQIVLSSSELILRQSHGYILREDISLSSHLKVEVFLK